VYILVVGWGCNFDQKVCFLVGGISLENSPLGEDNSLEGCVSLREDNLEASLSVEDSP
jgi:hypothetical protein